MAKDNNLTEFLQDTADAIKEAKGGSTDKIDAQKFSDEIKALKLSEQTKDANATKSQILQDASAYVKGKHIDGTMPNKGAYSITLNPGGSAKIPQGYHNGNGTVTANNTPSWNGSGVTTENRDENGLQGTWVFHEDINLGREQEEWRFNFSSNGMNFNGMVAGYDYEYENYYLWYIPNDSTSTDPTAAYVGENGYWRSSNFRTINITSDISEVELGSSVLEFLNENATKQPLSSGIYYNNSTVAYPSSNKIITLPVKGLKMDSDIKIVIA